MLRIAICEDNDAYRQTVSDLVWSILEEKSILGSVVLECASPDQAIASIPTSSPNVFFLDIDFNAEKTGLDVASFIHDTVRPAYIVFLSQYTNLVFQSFKVRPFDFLPKPVSKEDLTGVLTEIAADLTKKTDAEQPDLLSIKIGSQLYYVPKKEILFLEKYGNKCIVHSKEQTIHCYQSLEAISDKLDDTQFIRCHKSYIVNKQFIAKLDLPAKEIYLTNGQICLIGGKFKNDLLARLN